ncbi:MAG: hypothetical protein AAB278_08790 [Pseudomonadota bacterium]
MTLKSIPAGPTANPKKATTKPVIKPQKKHKKKSDALKNKVVRDSFTMPQVDYALIAELKEKALASGIQVKKSELLRAGLRLLANTSAAQLKKAVTDLEKIKTGRPKKV